MPNSNQILKRLFAKIGEQMGKIDFSHPDHINIVNRIGRGKIITPDHPSNFMTKSELKVILKESYIETHIQVNTITLGTELDNLTELIIENSTGKHKFFPVDWQN